jgi:NAD(P)-dependent dehydrogenase (short-subunit alcohol dehydrogenase family)
MDYRSLFRLDGKAAAVFGAGSGIGRVACAALSAHGARVACFDINHEAAERVAGETENDLPPRRVDIASEEDVRNALEEIVDLAGRLDVVVTTPGVNVRKPILSYSRQEFDRVMEVNLRGTFNVLKEAGRIMSERGGGSIIAFSSIRSLVVEPGQGVYAATKAGIIQLVRGLASELGGRNVRVNAIAPGVVDTPLTAQIKEDREWHEAYSRKSALGRWARAEEMAGPVVFLSSEASSFVTGAVLFVDGGWTAIDGRFTPPLP